MCLRVAFFLLPFLHICQGNLGGPDTHINGKIGAGMLVQEAGRKGAALE